MQHQGVTLWFTGLSGSGKTTIAKAVESELRSRHCKVEMLDGDIVRTNLSKGLGFSKEDRDTNVRRIGFVANLLSRNGVIAITAAISPYRDIRDEVRQRTENFMEVYVNAPLDICETRDVKGLYAKARAGENHSAMFTTRGDACVAETTRQTLHRDQAATTRTVPVPTAQDGTAMRRVLVILD